MNSCKNSNSSNIKNFGITSPKMIDKAKIIKSLDMQKEIKEAKN
jgi:hypothetical protein